MRDRICGMKSPVLAVCTLIFSFLGIADAWYLTQSAYTSSPLLCDIGGLDGCNTVAQSAYSHLFGYPLALYGVFFFGFIFVLAALTLYRPHRVAYLGLYVLGALGLIASIVFVCIQLFLIKAVCVYCFGSATLSLFIFLSVHLMWKRERNSLPIAPVRAEVPTVLP
jgi:uncharacterized membrane protein